MRVEIITNGLQTDISNYIESMTWSGDKNQMARKLAFSYLYMDENTGIQKVEVGLGTRILLYDEAVLLFDGICIERERKETEIKMSVSAADYAWYLKSKVFGTFQGTPQQISTAVLQANGIPVGTMLQTAGSTEVISTGDKTIYDVISTAYEAVGLEAYLYMQSLQVCTGMFGEAVCGTVTGDDFVIDASYKESIENLVDRVAIVDQESKLIEAIEEKQDIRRFGVVQEVYKHSDTKKNALEEAKKLFRSIENSGSITVKGDTRFVTGTSIIVEKVHAAIQGRFQITSDNHRIQNGSHTVSLTLQFDEVIT